MPHNKRLFNVIGSTPVLRFLNISSFLLPVISHEFEIRKELFHGFIEWCDHLHSFESVWNPHYYFLLVGVSVSDWFWIGGFFQFSSFIPWTFVCVSSLTSFSNLFPSASFPLSLSQQQNFPFLYYCHFHPLYSVHLSYFDY